ncbi:hypothetical protein EHF44_01195 (plasmid) [Cupriavidus pauculus]|uniref:Uncharacterized protein n=1 Tax=Cupriavidus pauculus TaxID=82633 RepID=A0A3G8GVW7_9BURK|nr:hypothetical protein EHF44_01195 [Cupriavidus pauculus]QGS27409.1 hypothetical protein FOB83_00215 [Cupriavidus metallidurans]
MKKEAAYRRRSSPCAVPPLTPAPLRCVITHFGCLITYFGNVITRFGKLITDFGGIAEVITFRRNQRSASARNR